MKLLCVTLCVAAIFEGCVAPPVTANKKEDAKENEVEQEHKGGDWDVGLEYNRYLQEVVQALESDPQFREKLEKAEVADIRTGKIAAELDFVNHNVRSKLDELKRTEMERLRHLAIKQAELERMNQGGETMHPVDPSHIDHSNPHTFEIDDLRKLIVKTTQDLEEVDRKRREEFKEYEMQKEFEKQQQLNLLDEQHKKEMEQKIKEQEEKHRKHPNLHHPGSKDQLEEVWEEQDHMNPEDFNPKTFFHLHDLDGNGYWDADEVKALFQKELDKMYDPNAPEDDMRERREEMERMREHVFNETDTNRDRLISYDEFLVQTKKQEFEQDPGWDGLDKEKVYTNEEYANFEKRRNEEIERMIQQGMLPPSPDLHLPYGMQVPPEYLQQQHERNMQFQQQHHQIPPYAQPQYHPQGGAPVHQGQMPQYQYQHGSPDQGHQPNYQQQQGYHPPAPHAYANVPHPDMMQHPNAVPPQGNHPNIPVHQNVQGHRNTQGHPQNIPVHQNIPPPQHIQGEHPNIQQGHFQNVPPQNVPVHQNVPPQKVPVHQNVPPQQNVPIAQTSQQVHQNSAQVHQNVPQNSAGNPPQQVQNVPENAHNSQQQGSEHKESAQNKISNEIPSH